jgi:glycosyltransferase involved in cell wall biosynthesis
LTDARVPRIGLKPLREHVARRRRLHEEHRDLTEVVAGTQGPARQALVDRMTVLLRALERPVPSGASAGDLARAVEDALASDDAIADGSRMWLALAVLTGRLPLDDDVAAALRRLRLDGPGSALGPPLSGPTSLLRCDDGRPARVEVVVGAVVVDMHHTSETELATGIQRVARETARRWHRDHDIELFGWTDDYTALRRLDPRSARRALGEHPPEAASHHRNRERALADVVVPWRGTYTIIELATEEPRTRRMQAMTRWSGNRTGVVGHDCVPLFSSETAGESMGGAFAGLLAGVRHMDRVATVSEASAVEYRGWRAMLGGSGWSGPQIRAVPLPVTALEPSAEAVDRARSRFCVGSLPLVLTVGSHEPRKNHLAVLHAAELLWRRGVEFSLLFVGGNAWHSERFRQTLDGLRDAGRPVESVSGLDDETLWAAYELAHVVLFPSLSEGFGLPVAEALASGTPVITAGYGSMAETAAHGGAVLVDPRNDSDIADALARVLADPALHAELVAQARRRPRRTWDDYAEELWHTLVEIPHEESGAA